MNRRRTKFSIAGDQDGVASSDLVETPWRIGYTTVGERVVNQLLDDRLFEGKLQYMQDTTSNTQGKDTLTRDTIFDALSSQRRRYTLHYLAQNDGSAELRNLSEQLAAWEQDVPLAEVNWKQRKNVYTALQQVHLPRMDEMGIVDFDQHRGEIAVHDDAEDLQLYLDYVPENDIPWHKYYLGLSVFSGWLLIFAEVGIVPFNKISTVAWAGFVVVLFGGSAIAHTFDKRTAKLGREGPPPEFKHKRGDHQ